MWRNVLFLLTDAFLDLTWCVFGVSLLKTLKSGLGDVWYVSRINLFKDHKKNSKDIVIELNFK